MRVDIIAGLLGAGKTTIIEQLLAQKPPQESWAILVNEFGQIGLDQRKFARQENLQIKQVAGGCLCCLQGPLTQVALMQIIRQVRPQRLLIEPSGLGHPDELCQLLAQQQYQQHLQLHALVMVIDAQQLADERYLQLDSWRRGLASADALVFNKSECYQDAQRDVMAQLSAQYAQLPQQRIERGELSLAWLDSLPARPAAATQLDVSQPKAVPTVDLRPLAADELRLSQAQQQGIYSISVRVGSAVLFDALALQLHMAAVDALRIKGCLHTDSGWHWLSVVSAQVSLTPLEPQSEQIIEFIFAAAPQQDQVLALLTNCRSN